MNRIDGKLEVIFIFLKNNVIISVLTRYFFCSSCDTSYHTDVTFSMELVVKSPVYILNNFVGSWLLACLVSILLTENFSINNYCGMPIKFLIQYIYLPFYVVAVVGLGRPLAL